MAWWRRDPTRAAGVAAAVAGVGLAVVLQVIAPVGLPLYDGVPVTEPYRYLHPEGSRPGDPTSFTDDLPLKGADSPPMAAATTESPPQAQLIAQQGAFVLGSGVRGVHVTITPVDPGVAPADGAIAGNVYRFTVTDQAGTPLAIKPCDGCISLVLRAPEGLDNGRLQRFAGGAWVDVQSSHAAGLYSTNPVALGEYAIVTGGTGGTGEDDGMLFGLPFDEVVVAGGVAVVLALLLAAALLVRNRPPSAPAPARARAIPSKRKKPRPRTGEGRGRQDR